jgi:AcrR family transcriptional regulator
MTSTARRSYRSTLRASQARQTRQAIVSAARRLFARDGFGATTIDAIADEAGVSRKTVFTSVGGKVELLKLALDWAIAGDDQPIAVEERPEMIRLLGLRDPAALLRGWAQVLVEIDARVAALVRAMELAAELDPAARSVFEEAQGQRLKGARTVVDRLLDLDALNQGLTTKEATDIAWFFGDPTLFDRFVRKRGWSIGRFTDWLANALCRELLASRRTPRRRRNDSAGPT